MIEIVNQIDDVMEAFQQLKSLEKKIDKGHFKSGYLNAQDAILLNRLISIIHNTKDPDIVLYPDLDALGIGEA